MHYAAASLTLKTTTAAGPLLAALGNTMKYISIIIFSLYLVACAGNAPKNIETNETWPKTVDEAVTVLKTEWLSEEDIEWIRNNPKESVTAKLHLPFGTGVRNQFGLWGHNTDLLQSCGNDHAEACSGIIFDALWESIRAETPAELAAAMDCQFSLANEIVIDSTGFYKMRIGEVISNLQDQVDLQLSKIERSCANKLQLIPIGNPDTKCWVRYEFESASSLNMFLNWFSWRNGFSVGSKPPAIELKFKEQCSWPERPKYFEPEKA